MILIIDDCPDNAKALAQLARLTGLEACAVPSGELALQYLQSHRPDLIVLDLMMPGMSGLELLAAIRAKPDWKSIPVMIYSASVTGAEALQAQGIGCDGGVHQGQYRTHGVGWVGSPDHFCPQGSRSGQRDRSRDQPARTGYSR